MVKVGNRRGVALVFVLWLLVLLGVIIADVASQARAEAAILSSLRSRTVARYAAESGILAATVRYPEAEKEFRLSQAVLERLASEFPEFLGEDLDEARVDERTGRASTAASVAPD